MEKLEMVICPKCGKPYPKKRQELGYNYCVNCSTEKPLVCHVEEHGEGDHTYDTIHIMTQDEALDLYRIEHNGKIEIDPEYEPDVDYSTFEQQEEATASMSPAERESYLEQLEAETAGLSERTLEDLTALSEEDYTEEEDG